MDARPVLDVINLTPSLFILKRRKRLLSDRLAGVRTTQEKQRLYYVLSTYRKRQKMRLTSSSIEDPDPYEPTYLFYCFTGTPSN